MTKSMTGQIASMLAVLALAGCSRPPVEPLTVTRIATEAAPLRLPMPAPVQPPVGIEPLAVTPEIAGRMAGAVEAGRMPPFALVCFNTEDRLAYQAWVEDLLRYIEQLQAVIEAQQAHRHTGHNRKEVRMSILNDPRLTLDALESNDWSITPPLDPRALLDEVIAPALDAIGLYSGAAAELVLGTALQESIIGDVAAFPAGRGRWRLASFRWSRRRMTISGGTICSTVPISAPRSGSRPSARQTPQDVPAAAHLISDLGYAAAMCRVHYGASRMPCRMPAMCAAWVNTGRRITTPIWGPAMPKIMWPPGIAGWGDPIPCRRGHAGVSSLDLNPRWPPIAAGGGFCVRTFGGACQHFKHAVNRCRIATCMAQVGDLSKKINEAVFGFHLDESGLYGGFGAGGPKRGRRPAAWEGD